MPRGHVRAFSNGDYYITAPGGRQYSRGLDSPPGPRQNRRGSLSGPRSFVAVGPWRSGTFIGKLIWSSIDWHPAALVPARTFAPPRQTSLPSTVRMCGGDACGWAAVGLISPPALKKRASRASRGARWGQAPLERSRSPFRPDVAILAYAAGEFRPNEAQGEDGACRHIPRPRVVWSFAP